MDKVLITGSSGFLGSNLTLYLADKGFSIHALARTESIPEFLNHPNITIFKGDVRDLKTVETAMKGCKYVFHTAAIANAWLPNPQEYYEVNYTGTKNIFETALKLKVSRVVLTSTAGIWANSKNIVINEDTERDIEFYLEYERTKFLAQELRKDYIKDGLDIVTVNPTRVYGPGRLSKSNATTQMIIDYVKGDWHFIPGDGRIIANYAFVEDVVEGHYLALQKGKTGEAYILGGENIDYNHFFTTLGTISNTKKRLIGLPRIPIQSVAYLGEKMTKIAPIDLKLTTGMVKKLFHNFNVSSDKAIRELGYTITPLSKGMQKTLAWYATSRPQHV